MSKYIKNITVCNNEAALHMGYEGKLDITDLAIIDYLSYWCLHSKHSDVWEYNGKKYTWVNYNALLSALPFISVRNKISLTKRMKVLRDLGIIKTKSKRNNRLYVRFNRKFIKEYFDFEHKVEEVKEAKKPKEKHILKYIDVENIDVIIQTTFGIIKEVFEVKKVSRTYESVDPLTNKKIREELIKIITIIIHICKNVMDKKISHTHYASILIEYVGVVCDYYINLDEGIKIYNISKGVNIFLNYIEDQYMNIERFFDLTK